MKQRTGPAWFNEPDLKKKIYFDSQQYLSCKVKYTQVYIILKISE